MFKSKFLFQIHGYLFVAYQLWDGSCCTWRTNVTFAKVSRNVFRDKGVYTLTKQCFITNLNIYSYMKAE